MSGRRAIRDAGHDSGAILFITANRIGDAVLSTGLLAYLAAARPNAAITVVCGPLPAPLFANAPGVTQVLPVVKQRAAMHWLSLWRHLVVRRWSVVVDLRASLFAGLVRARERRTARPGAARYRVQQAKVRELADVLGLADPPPPVLWPTSDDALRAARLLGGRGEFVAMGPTANWPGKEWPAERFVRLGRQLCGPGGRFAGQPIAVLGGAGEEARAQAVVRGLLDGGIDTLDLVGRCDLPVTAACLARARLYIGNDSGLMHMAAAVGAPTLGLFGPTDERVYGPWGEHTAVVRAPEPFDRLQAQGLAGHMSGLMDGLTV
ncbi:MAG: glycosyltransferase family 9 protein, partial [Alphaproteobacteria bacterium]